MSGQLQLPPARWRRILEAVVPGEDREHVVNELDTLYAERLERLSTRAADRWYRIEVVSFVTKLAFAGLASRTRRWMRQAMEVRISEVADDVRSAVRSMRRSLGVPVLAAVTLGVGIGAGTLMFSVVDNIVFRSLPYWEPDRIVALWPNLSFTRGEIEILEREAETLESVAAYMVSDGHNLELPNESRRISGTVVSPELLRILGIEPILGRGFRSEEATPGSDGVVLLSHSLWLDQFGADPETVGRSIMLDGRSRTVVGVLPNDFAFPRSDQDVLIPLEMDPANAGSFWGNGGYRVVGRLFPGATSEDARAELQRLNILMSESNPIWTPDPAFKADGQVVELQSLIIGDVQGTLLILLGSVGLLLLIGCGNAANLLLARGLSRERIFAVRSALGASRARLIREQLIESLLIAGVGCVLALVGSRWLLSVIVSVMPPEVPRSGEISLDGRVALVGMLLGLFAAIAAGLIPALRGSGVDPSAALRDGGQRSVGAAKGSRRLSHATVVAQMAAAVVLMSSAGLLMRSFDALTSVDTGFESEGVTVARLTLGANAYAEVGERLRFFEAVAEGVGVAPGVERAAIASYVPFGAGFPIIATYIEDVTLDPNNLDMFMRIQVTTDYFETMGIPLTQGRGFNTSDREGAPLVALVDATAAGRFWPGESPVGRRIRYPYAGAEWIEIVGVVGGVADNDLTAARMPKYYQPLAQVTGLNANLVVRSSGDDVAVAAAMRDVVAGVDERVPISRLGAMRDLVGASVARQRWTTVLLTLFAATALLMGGIGIYGVVAYSVRQRTQEIGIRLALGASRGRIQRQVVRDGLLLAISGALLGVAIAVPGGRLIDGLLFGISPLDPIAFGAVLLVSIVTGLLAVYVPAARATRVDPLAALREEG